MHVLLFVTPCPITGLVSGQRLTKNDPNRNTKYVCFTFSAQNLVILRCCFAEEGLEMQQDEQRTFRAISCFLNLLFSDVFVAVAVVVCFKLHDAKLVYLLTIYLQM